MNICFPFEVYFPNRIGSNGGESLRPTNFFTSYIKTKLIIYSIFLLKNIIKFKNFHFQKLLQNIDFLLKKTRKDFFILFNIFKSFSSMVTIAPSSMIRNILNKLDQTNSIF